MGAALRFKTAQVPRQQGERARLKVVRGPDLGATFVVTQNRAVIGRGEESDVVLMDLKASRQHAELTFVQTGQGGDQGTWRVRDLKSANGILHNGKASREAVMNKLDTLGIGETVLQLLLPDQGTAMLLAPVRAIHEIEAEQAAFEEQRKRVRSMGVIGASGGAQGGLGMIFKPSATAGGAAPSQANPKKLILYGLVGLLGLMTFLDNEKGQKPPTGGANQPKASSSKDSRDEGSPVMDLKDYLPQVGDPSINKSTDVMLKSAFREYNQGNWLRAKLQFETVLQILPSHPIARRYLRNCDNFIRGEVKWHLEIGKKAFQTGRFRSARGHFEAVLRLLYRDVESKEFKNASSQLEDVNKQIKGADEGGTSG